MNDAVTAVVLAAGAGTRFGGGKLLAQIGGRPILQHVLDALAAAGVDDVVVVLGADTDAIEATIDWRSERRVRNLTRGEGCRAPSRIGIKAVADDARPRSSPSAISPWSRSQRSAPSWTPRPTRPDRSSCRWSARTRLGRNPSSCAAAFGLVAEAEE